MKEVGSGGWGRRGWGREGELWLLTWGDLRSSVPMAILVCGFWLLRKGLAISGWSLAGVSRASLDDCITASRPEQHWPRSSLCYILLLSPWIGREKEALRGVNVFCNKGPFSYQLGWKSPGNINESSRFRCDFSSPAAYIVSHVRRTSFVGPTDPFSHLTTKPEQLAPKLLLRNAFCITHHSSCTETSFSISQSLVVCFVLILFFFPPNYLNDSAAHSIVHVVSWI